MPFRNNIISQRQTQPCSLPGWLGCKEWLKYFIQYFLRNAIAIVLHFDLYLTTIFFCAHGNNWFIPVSVYFLFFSNCIKCIIDQVEYYPANILGNDVYFLNAIIKFGFKFCIERFVFGS